MPTPLPRAQDDDLPATIVLRALGRPARQHLATVLPWAVPILTYSRERTEWVRWSMPMAAAERFGLAGGCQCCGDKPNEDTDGIQFDTVLAEVSDWLTDNGYITTIPTTTGETSS